MSELSNEICQSCPVVQRNFAGPNVLCGGNESGSFLCGLTLGSLSESPYFTQELLDEVTVIINTIQEREDMA